MRRGCTPTSAGLLVTGTFGVTLIHSMVDFFIVRRNVRLQCSQPTLEPLHVKRQLTAA